MFGVGWFAYDPSKDRHALFLGTAFLAVGLVVFMHALGNAAMPAFVTPNSANKSTASASVPDAGVGRRYTWRMILRTAVRVLVSCSIAAALLGGAAVAGDAAAGATPVALTPAALEWQPVPVLPGMTFARVWGPAEGAQGRFVRIPANGRLPLHRHTATVRVVVVSGTYVYGLEGEPERGYGAGSFIVTPGGLPHVAGCSEACLYYEEVTGRPDFIPVARRSP